MAPIPIITVTYSPGQHLQSFLDSVHAVDGAQVLMVDNGSTDGSVEAAADSGAAELLRSGRNIGYGAAMNLGVKHIYSDRGYSKAADSEYFLIANPDVIFTPKAIEELYAAAQRHPRAAAIGPKIEEVDGSIYPSARSIPDVRNGIGHALVGKIWPANPWTQRYLSHNDMDIEREAGWLSGSCMLLRRDAFESIGGFDERYFMYMEDVDLCDRLARAGWLNIYAPAAVIHHAQGHSASRHPEITIPAHHASAYRFQADRLTGWKNAPLRVLLRVGLWCREKIALRLALARLRSE